MRDHWNRPANGRICGLEETVGESEPHSCPSTLCDQKIGILNLVDNACLGIHRTRLPLIQRLSTLHSSHSRRKVRRWLYLLDVSEFAHHCCSWSSRRTLGWCLGGSTSIRTERYSRRLNSPDGSVFVCLNDSTEF